MLHNKSMTESLFEKRDLLRVNFNLHQMACLNVWLSQDDLIRILNGLLPKEGLTLKLTRNFPD